MGILFCVYLAMGGAALGLLEFGVGAMLWSEQKVIIAVGAVAALCGLYLGIMVVYVLVSPYLS